jgi:arginyl-tRNA synthetase
MIIREQVKKDLTVVLKKLRIHPQKLVLEHPTESNHGDYSTNIALISWQKNYSSAFDLATKIVNEWRSSGLPEYLAKIEIAPPGFINLWLSQDYLISQLSGVIEKKKKTKIKSKKCLMVEFAHPNTHKQFHIGHLRNICLGEAVCRLLQANGESVCRVNYQGDVGLHVAKCLWGILKLKKATPRSLSGKIELLGKAYVKGNKAYEEDQKAKTEIEVINQKIYQQDKEIVKLWKETRSWSLDYFDQIYQRLDTKFDRFYFESEVAQKGKEIVLQGLKKKIFQKSEGAIIFPGEKYGLHNRVFLNQRGLPTYEGKDLGLAQKQLADFAPEKILHVVGPEQKGYFEVVFKALEKIDSRFKDREFHLSYGWVRLKNGKMSSRTGQVVLGEWLLAEVKKRLKKVYQMSESLAEKVAVGAVKYSMLKFSPQSEIVFDIDESISLEGDSGPYLQYTYARCQSVLEKSEENFKNLGGDFAHLHLKAEEISLLRSLYQFEELVWEAGEKFATNLVCRFLFDLAQKYNLFYNRHSILKADGQKTVQFRLFLTLAVSQVIKNGLQLLGIESPQKM